MLTRRRFLAGAALTGGAAVVGRATWPTRRSDALVVHAPVYGPLGEPDGDGVRVPPGFRSRVVARSGEEVAGTGYVWHHDPDGGACFARPAGGWTYVSNSEGGPGEGKVSAIDFDASGRIAAARAILTGTDANCAGGATSWGTWLSCEEVDDGHVWECDPTGAAPGVERPLLGTFRHEAAAEDPVTGIVYLTEDHPEGRLYRFVPVSPGDLSAGSLQAAKVTGDRLDWVAVASSGPERSAATTAFPGGEGLARDGRRLYVTTKGDVRIHALDLDTRRWSLFYDAAHAASALTAVDNAVVHPASGDLYVAEDGGDMQLVQLVAGGGEVVAAPVVQFVGHPTSEVTGPAFSPDGTRLYLSSQRGPDGSAGWTIEVTGPFRTTRVAGAAGVSGVVHPDRLGVR